VVSQSYFNEEHVKLLIRELTLSGFKVNEILPIWSRPATVRRTVLNELLFAMNAQVHEGRISPYGSVLFPPSASLANVLELSANDRQLAQKAADGSSSLAAFIGAEFTGLLLLKPASTPELQISELAAAANAIAIRRDARGVLRVFSEKGILRHVGRIWTSSPALNLAVEHVSRVAPQINQPMLLEILKFAYYVLSAWHIGATFVWLLSDRDDFESGVDLRSLGLRVDPREKDPPLAFSAHLLDQYDGATVISKGGQILKTQVQLMPSNNSKNYIKPLSGTRHTSAKRASFDRGDIVVITVSSDGPVTVFSDGLDVYKITWYSAFDQARAFVRATGPENRESVDAASFERVCSNCGKTSRVEVFTVYGFREREEANCPICGTKIASAMCFRIDAMITKSF
jgi:DNA integrity scanning protein DisA with diadenylate cyclase activity